MTALLALLIFAPHGQWLAHAHANLAGRMEARLHPGDHAGWLSSVEKGSLTLSLVTCGFVLPLLGAYGLALLAGRGSKALTPLSGDLWQRFLARLLLIEALLLAVLIVGFQVTGFKSHWLQPLLFVLPTYLLLRFRRRVTRSSSRWGLTLAV